LGDADLDEAQNILEILQRHVGGDQVAACEIKLRRKRADTKFLREAEDATQRLRIQAEELKKSLGRLREL